jgi:hypothetical protein
MASVPVRDTQKETHRGKDHVKMKVGTEAMKPQAKEQQEAQGAERGKEQNLLP